MAPRPPQNTPLVLTNHNTAHFLFENSKQYVLAISINNNMVYLFQKETSENLKISKLPSSLAASNFQKLFANKFDL